MSDKEVRMSINRDSSHVIVEFERPQQFVRLSPRQAIEMAKALVVHIEKLDPKSSNIIMLPH